MTDIYAKYNIDPSANSGSTIGSRAGSVVNFLAGAESGAAKTIGRPIQSLLRDIPTQTTRNLAQDIKQRQSASEAAYVTPDISGMAGKAVGSVAPFIAAAPFVPESLAGSTLGRLGLSTAIGATQAPQHQLLGGALGGLLGATGEVGTRILPKLFLGHLAKGIKKAYEVQKSVAKNLYTKAFAGTENVAPILSTETQSALNDLKPLFPGKRNEVAKAINTYNNKNTIEGMHGLRSDLSKVREDITPTMQTTKKSGLTSTQLNEIGTLDDAIKGLQTDTKTNLANVSPDNANKYEIAQAHWKNNVVPFKKVDAVRKLLGGKRHIKPALFKDLAQSSLSEAGKISPEEQVRKLIGARKGILQTGEFLHRKYFGIPIGLALAAGIGPSAYIGEHLLGTGKPKT